MKKLSILYFVLCSVCIYAQSLPLSFQLTEQATTRIGIQWDYSYSPISDSIQVEFSGNTFSMITQGGKTILSTDIKNYVFSENKKGDVVTNSSWILEFEKDTFTQYITISEYISEDAELQRYVSIPKMNKRAQVFAYQYYR